MHKRTEFRNFHTVLRGPLHTFDFDISRSATVLVSLMPFTQTARTHDLMNDAAFNLNYQKISAINENPPT